MVEQVVVAGDPPGAAAGRVRMVLVRAGVGLGRADLVDVNRVHAQLVEQSVDKFFLFLLPDRGRGAHDG